MDLDYLQKINKSKELQDLEWIECRDNPYYFLTHWAFTLDTHDTNEPIKAFPEKEYIKIIVDIWLKNNLLLVPKSRQMMMSWLFIALYLWNTQFYHGKLNFFQSKKAEDADDLIKRAKFIYDHEPKFLKRYIENNKFHELKVNPQHGGQHTQGKMTFPDINSEIRGVPEGGDIVRMHTLSGILSDEMGFQPEAKAAYVAAKPTISSGGRFTGVSTAEDNTFFQELVFDKLEVI